MYVPQSHYPYRTFSNFSRRLSMATIADRKQTKLNWTLFMVSFSFVLFVTPRVVYTFLYGSIHASGFSHKKDPWFDLFLYCLYWCQYAMNFFIYVVRIKEYRLAYIFFLKEVSSQSRVFLLRQLWVVNCFVKSSSNNLSNKNKLLCVSR